MLTFYSLLRYPVIIIAISIAFAILTSIPLMIGSNTKSVESLIDGSPFVPESSEFLKNSKWLDEKNLNKDFNSITATRIMIVSDSEDGNLLTSKNFELVRKINEFVYNFSSTQNISYTDQCLESSRLNENDARLEKFSKDQKSMRSKTTASKLKMLSKLFPYPAICEFIDHINSKKVSSCFAYTPLQQLKQQTVIDTKSKMQNNSFDNDSTLLELLNGNEKYLQDIGKSASTNQSSFGLIGGISRSSEGSITAAKALFFMYFLKDEKKINSTELRIQKEFQKQLKAALISNFQSAMVESALEMIVVNNVKPERGDPMKHDKLLVGFGGLLVVIHLVTSFSKCNSIEQRFGLGFCGLISIGLSLVSMNGLGKLFGLPLDITVILVMIIMVGIGADDMFVVIQSVKSTKPHEQEPTDDIDEQYKSTRIDREGLIEWIGTSVRNSAGSIFMTSLTDCLAFAIGGLSVIPLLRDTCLLSSIGVVMLFLYMNTFFVGFLTLDQMRIESKRDGFLCCIKVYILTLQLLKK